MARVHVPDDHAFDPASYVFSQYVPEMGSAALKFSHAVYQGTSLSLREMEAARNRTAHINGCAMCIKMRAAKDLDGYLESVGGDPSQAPTARGGPAPDEAFYEAILNWRDADFYSERERLAIEYAERLGEAPRSMEEDEEFWERMHAAFSDKEIVDLSFSISSWIALGRVIHTLQLDTVCIATDMPAY